MSKIYVVVLPLLFFIQYFGISAIAQIIIVMFIVAELLRGNTIFFSDADKVLFFGVIVIFIFKVIQMPIEVNFRLFRFYWGFVLFYLFFLTTKFKLNFLILFWLTLSVSIIEAILINTILPLQAMKNIPVAHIEVLALEESFGYIKRAYGLASSPTSSATILVILLTCIYVFQKEKFKEFYILITLAGLMAFGSGTGFFLFFVFLFIRYKLYSGFKIILGLLVLFATVIFVLSQDLNEGGFLMRMSGNYFETLIELKSSQITSVLDKINKSVYDSLFGASYQSVSEARVMSDFGWIDFLECYGFLGIPLFIFFLLLKRSLFTFPIMIIIIGYFHYPAIGSIPGQILIAGILTYHLADEEEISSSIMNNNISI